MTINALPGTLVGPKMTGSKPGSVPASAITSGTLPVYRRPAPLWGSATGPYVNGVFPGRVFGSGKGNAGFIAVVTGIDAFNQHRGLSVRPFGTIVEVALPVQTTSHGSRWSTFTPGYGTHTYVFDLVGSTTIGVIQQRK